MIELYLKRADFMQIQDIWDDFLKLWTVYIWKNNPATLNDSTICFHTKFGFIDLAAPVWNRWWGKNMSCQSHTACSIIFPNNSENRD